MMDEEWAPILNKDCLFSAAVHTLHQDDVSFAALDHTYSSEVKSEPLEDSDYQGSSSGSPSSSLSSPDVKDQLGVDLSFGLPAQQFAAHNGFLHSPASSSGSPFGSGLMFPSCGVQMSPNPLPPVSHFSQTNTLVHHNTISQNAMFRPDSLGFYEDERSPSPLSSDRSSPEVMNSMMGMAFEHVPTFHSASYEEMDSRDGLSCSQQAAAALKSRSKMHEMAVKQRLITDQDPRSEGMVQLSAEERRTLIQEGYTVPSRLPLNKGEEEALKIVRRKIKNKLSAQESRRKRKEYMDTLEQRCQGYYADNSQLKGRVRQLEMANKQLMGQVKKLQDLMIAHGHSIPNQ